MLDALRSGLLIGQSVRRHSVENAKKIFRFFVCRLYMNSKPYFPVRGIVDTMPSHGFHRMRLAGLQNLLVFPLVFQAQVPLDGRECFGIGMAVQTFRPFGIRVTSSSVVLPWVSTEVCRKVTLSWKIGFTIVLFISLHASGFLAGAFQAGDDTLTLPATGYKAPRRLLGVEYCSGVSPLFHNREKRAHHQAAAVIS